MIMIEYHEAHVAKGERLKLLDVAGARVQVLEVRSIGDEVRIQYAVIRGE